MTSSQLDVLREAIPGGLSDLVVALDGDDAGTKAAVRLWHLLDPAEAANVRAVIVPDGADPADLVKNERGAELRTMLTGAAPLTDVVVERTLASYNLDWVEHRVAAVREVAAAVASMPASSVAAAAGQVQHAMGEDAPEALFDIFMSAHLDALDDRVGVTAPTDGSGQRPSGPAPEPWTTWSDRPDRSRPAGFAERVRSALRDGVGAVSPNVSKHDWRRCSTATSTCRSRQPGASTSE